MQEKFHFFSITSVSVVWFIKRDSHDGRILRVESEKFNILLHIINELFAKFRLAYKDGDCF